MGYDYSDVVLYIEMYQYKLKVTCHTRVFINFVSFWALCTAKFCNIVDFHHATHKSSAPSKFQHQHPGDL